jgi:hypothetical protein
METAHPNFGNSEYVTGLQPNIRPQRVVLVLRRRFEQKQDDPAAPLPVSNPAQ